MQTDEFIIDQFIMFMMSSEQYVCMAHQHSAFTQHCQSQAGKLLMETLYTGKKQRHHMSLSDGIIKQNCSVKECMVETFCSGMLLQGHVMLNMASAQPHQHGTTGQSHNHRSTLVQVSESVIDQSAMTMMPLL